MRSIGNMKDAERDARKKQEKAYALTSRSVCLLAGAILSSYTLREHPSHTPHGIREKVFNKESIRSPIVIFFPSPSAIEPKRTPA